MSENVLLQANKYFSDIRMYRYTERYDDRNLDSYITNITISSILFGLLGIIEIILRNLTNITLTTAYEDDYLISPNKYKIFNTHEQRIISNIQKEVMKLDLHNKSSRILTQLTFGFWCKLFENNKLWCKCLHKIYLKETRKKYKITFSSNLSILTRLLALRNKIAHHERILDKLELEFYAFNPMREIFNWLIHDADKNFKEYMLAYLDRSIDTINTRLAELDGMNCKEIRDRSNRL